MGYDHSIRAETKPLHIMTNQKVIVQVCRWYPVGADFIIHRTIEDDGDCSIGNGWTVTHTRSHMAIIQKVRTRGMAFKIAGELALLTDKWPLFEDQKSMKRILNHRERGAVLDLILKVQASREWSFR